MSVAILFDLKSDISLGFIHMCSLINIKTVLGLLALHKCGSTWGLKNSGMSECHFLKKNVCQNVTR